jgi:hypothetical protein
MPFPAIELVTLIVYLQLLLSSSILYNPHSHQSSLKKRQHAYLPIHQLNQAYLISTSDHQAHPTHSFKRTSILLQSIFHRSPFHYHRDIFIAKNGAWISSLEFVFPPRSSPPHYLPSTHARTTSSLSFPLLFSLHISIPFRSFFSRTPTYCHRGICIVFKRVPGYFRWLSSTSPFSLSASINHSPRIVIGRNFSRPVFASAAITRNEGWMEKCHTVYCTSLAGGSPEKRHEMPNC